MESYHYVDIFATKGIEYLLVLAFLAVLILYWRYLNKPAAMNNRAAIPEKIKTTLVDWFYLADNFLYHQGHSWVAPEGEQTVRVGMDDFSQKLVGKPARIDLPAIGSRVHQGERGWQLEVDGKIVEVLAPVNGEVVEVNREILKNPHLLNEDPYRKGWLLKVKPERFGPDRKNLLSGELARAWIEDHVNRLSRQISGELGQVLQDGGLPSVGFAKDISPENWEQIVQEYLLTEPATIS